MSVRSLINSSHKKQQHVNVSSHEDVKQITWSACISSNLTEIPCKPRSAWLEMVISWRTWRCTLEADRKIEKLSFGEDFNWRNLQAFADPRCAARRNGSEHGNTSQLQFNIHNSNGLSLIISQWIHQLCSLICQSLHKRREIGAWDACEWNWISCAH